MAIRSTDSLLWSCAPDAWKDQSSGSGRDKSSDGDAQEILGEEVLREEVLGEEIRGEEFLRQGGRGDEVCREGGRGEEVPEP